MRWTLGLAVAKYSMAFEVTQNTFLHSDAAVLRFLFHVGYQRVLITHHFFVLHFVLYHVQTIQSQVTSLLAGRRFIPPQ
jgi:hypothetical protein